MKTMTKRIASLALAVMMAVVMLASAVPTKAFAAGVGSLTVTGGSDLVGKDVTIVRVFSATKSDANVAYKLEAVWESFFKGLDGAGLNNYDGEVLSQAAYDYIAKLESNPEDMIALAKAAREHVRADKSQTFDRLSVTVAAVKEANGAKAKFADVENGYYLVFPEGGSTSAERKTDAMLLSVLGEPKTMAIKSVFPTVDKTVDDSQGNSAAVGDVLTFTLTSAVPDMTDYKKYVFTFKDVLSKGLTLQNNGADATPGDVKSAFTVTIGKDPGTSVTEFTAKAEVGDTEGETKLTIELGNYLLANRDTLKVGDPITVTYQAKLNEKAVVDDKAGNTNKATIEYSTDPTDEQGGIPDSSTEDITKTYTFKFGIEKQDDKKNPLAGAKFQIRKDDGDKTYSADKDQVIKFNRVADDKYILAANGDVTEITSPTGGKFSVEGLDEGVYWIEETAAPDGYNKLAKPIKVTITAEIDPDTGGLTNHTVVYGESDSATDHNTGHYIVIVNKAGAELPETGGMGTILFTLVGAAAIGYGVYRKRTAKNVA